MGEIEDGATEGDVTQSGQADENQVTAIGRRLALIRQRLDEAAQRAGRDPAGVVLVGVSKGQPLAKLQAAWRAGLRVFGENRVQEALDKGPHLPPEADWHLIGPLQSNKAKRALELFGTVHSVDRAKIARTLDRHAAERGIRPRCFLEVNLGGEGSKHGFSPAGLAEAVRPLAELEHVEIVGLMAIPPAPETDDEAAAAEAARPWFRRLRALRDALGERPEWNGFPGLLSMGMSQDFEVAVEEGATHVRVGTSLFGPRTGIQ